MRKKGMNINSDNIKLNEHIKRILEIMRLNENFSFGIKLNRRNLSKVIKEKAKTYQNELSCSLEDINKGSCDDFAVDIAEYFFGPELAQELFFREFNQFRLVIHSDYAKFEDELEPHVWIVFDGKHYDAEAPNGVKSHLDLPIYKRQFNS